MIKPTTPTRCELRFCRALEAVLRRYADGDVIECPQSEARDYLDSLECYVCEVLHQHFAAFSLRELDGISPTLQKRTEAGAADLFAMCWRIEDQGRVPLHLRVRCRSGVDSIAELVCRWGEADPGSGDLLRREYSGKEVARLAFDPDSIPWLYHLHLAPPSPPTARRSRVCRQCESLFLLDPLGRADRCSECADASRGSRRREHRFGENRCLECYWDGSAPLDIEPSEGEA